MAHVSTFWHFFLKVGVLYNLKKTRALIFSYLNWDLNGRHLGYHRVQWWIVVERLVHLVNPCQGWEFTSLFGQTKKNKHRKSWRMIMIHQPSLTSNHHLPSFAIMNHHHELTMNYQCRVVRWKKYGFRIITKASPVDKPTPGTHRNPSGEASNSPVGVSYINGHTI